MSLEFDIRETKYRHRRLCAADQWALLRKLTPVMPALSGMDLGFGLPGLDLGLITEFLAPLSDLSDEDASAVFAACRGACERQGENGWEDVPPSLGISDLLTLVRAVVTENFDALFSMEHPRFSSKADEIEYDPVTMPNGEDFLFRPVERGYCRMESLYDGTLRIEHIAKANMAIDVRDENEARARKAAEKS